MVGVGRWRVFIACTLLACGVSDPEPLAPDAAAPSPPVSTAVPPSPPPPPPPGAPPDAGADADAGAPSPHIDGVRNYDETDVDCGGAVSPPCAVGKMCKVHADCVSVACRHDGLCVTSKSCTAQLGGTTCGPNGNDDCCAALPVPMPGAPFVLDKYMITAGRFRQFVERTGGNIRGFIQANRPAGWDPLWDAWLPTVMDDNTPGGRDGVYQQLGPPLYYPATGGNMGCFVEGVGARTYWLPPAINQSRFGDVQQYPQEYLDPKALNCVTQPMVAAFCAWDGGYLPTIEQLDYAWHAGDKDNHVFPWGNSPRPQGFTYAYNTEADALAFGEIRCNDLGTGPCDRRYAPWRYNAWDPPQLLAEDRSVFISRPGRYPLGNGPFGHADLAGLLFHWTSTMDGTTGTDPLTRLAQLSRSGSWNGHVIPYYPWDTPYVWGWKMVSKYWATGARCAR